MLDNDELQVRQIYGIIRKSFEVQTVLNVQEKKEIRKNKIYNLEAIIVNRFMDCAGILQNNLHILSILLFTHDNLPAIPERKSKILCCNEWLQNLKENICLCM